jgi:uncharacterized protein (DUF4415 family)
LSGTVYPDKSPERKRENMAIKRIGSARLPDAVEKHWNYSPNVFHAPPPDALLEREAAGPIITAAEMAPGEATPPQPKQKASKKPKKTSPAELTPVFPKDAQLTLSPVTLKEKKEKICLSIPVAVLARFREDGPGYQLRIAQVLAEFWNIGGRFVSAEEMEQIIADSVMET